MKLPKFTALLLAGALFVSVAACGKPSVEGSDKRYKSNKDKISVLITKQPANKLEFEKKVAEFEAEYQTAMAAGSDEEKIKKLGELNSRMEKYIGAFDKADTPAGGAAAPSDKLDKNAPAPAPGTAPAAGGKLDGPAGGQPASGGMGGGAPQPASGGMGGGAPAGGTAPAQPAPSGMGGM
jgi:hypothetical protein